MYLKQVLWSFGGEMILINDAEWIFFMQEFELKMDDVGPREMLAVQD